MTHDSDDPDLLRWAEAKDGLHFVGSGRWVAANGRALDALVTHGASLPGAGPGTIDLAAVKAIDTYGACLLDRLLAARQPGLTILNMAEPQRALYDAVARSGGRRSLKPRARMRLASIVALGRAMIEVGEDLVALLTMLGALGIASARIAASPRRLRLTSLVHQLDRVGFRAVPIILLITSLIGAIIAQQGIFHFRKFGAETYVVDLVGILVLREIGVLIVAIMVAGRSGSSFTAELGSMKMREEIDALRTMGLDPVEVLMLPRVAALVIALPLLTFAGSMAALTGGGLVAWLYGDMAPTIFITRLRDAISVTHFEVGMYKAPFMALVIGLVACTEGFRVKGNTESLGLRTTSSVVKAIFLVIVLDGFFAIFFASVGM